MVDLEKKARLHHALGEPTRLRILMYLMTQKEPACICRITQHIGKDQSVVFRHIQLLKEAELVSTKKQGAYLFCSLKGRARIKKMLSD